MRELHIASAARPYFRTHGLVAVWVLTWLAALAIELPHGFHQRPEAASKDRGSRPLFALCIAAGVVGIIVAPKLVPGAVIKPAVASFAVGEAVFIVGCALRYWSIRTLGRYFTREVMVSSDQSVVTTGPYRIVRHPSYTALLLYAAGSGLIWGNWIGFAAITVAMLVALIYRIRIEEEALSSALGDSYRSYASQHKRLVPLIW